MRNKIKIYVLIGSFFFIALAFFNFAFAACQESSGNHPAWVNTTVSTKPATFSANGLQTTLNWSVSGGTEDAYRVQVASDPAFSSVKVDTGTLYPTLHTSVSGSSIGCPVTAISASGNSITMNNQSGTFSFWGPSTCNPGTSVPTQTITIAGATATGSVIIPSITYNAWFGVTKNADCGISTIIASGNKLKVYGYSTATAASLFGNTYTCSGSTFLGAITLNGAVASGSTPNFNVVGATSGTLDFYVQSGFVYGNPVGAITLTATSPPPPFSLTINNSSLQPGGVYYWRVMPYMSNNGGYWVGPAWPTDSFNNAICLPSTYTYSCINDAACGVCGTTVKTNPWVCIKTDNCGASSVVAQSICQNSGVNSCSDTTCPACPPDKNWREVSPN